MKPKMIGSINACGTVILLDKNNKFVCKVMDTPNSIASAFKKHPEAIYSKGGIVKDYHRDDPDMIERMGFVKPEEFKFWYSI